MVRLLNNMPLARPGVYLLWCVMSAKGYVGISHVLSERIKSHENRWKGASGPKLKRALDKYGVNAFTVIPLYYSIDGTDHLPEVEADLIQAWNTFGDHGYNILLANGRVGPYGEEFNEILRRAAQSPEARAIRSAQGKARVSTPEGYAKMMEMVRLSCGPEGRAKRAASKRALYATPEGYQQILAMSAKGKTPEAIAKLKASRRVWIESEEGQKSIAVALERMNTPEARAKKSATLKAYFQTPEGRVARERLNSPDIRRRLGASLRLSNQHPEIKQRRRDAMKRWAATPEGRAALQRIRDIRAEKRAARGLETKR